MFFFRNFFLLIAALSFISCTSQNSAQNYRKEGNTVYPNLAYSKVDEKNLLLDIYLPPNSGKISQRQKPYPVILWIHGGGWRWGSKDSVPVLSLTKAGFALVSIDYRLDGHAKYPAQIDDCRAALRWIHQHAVEYHLDASRIGVLGASAGGHLAALLGTTGGNSPDFPKVQAVCALYPPTDLITVVKEEERDSSLTLVALLLGGPVDKKEALAKEGSPIHYVSPDNAPFFLIHGQLDTLVPVEQSQNLNKALLKSGVASTLKVLPDQKHGFYPDASLTREITQFFKKNMGN